MTERGIFNPGPLYQRPSFIRGAIILTPIAISIILFRNEISSTWQLLLHPSLLNRADSIQSLLILFWNLFLLLGIFFLTLMLVSQFILPVQSNDQRRRVFGRLIAFMTRQHGPAVFIKEGKEIAKKSELLSSLQGVAFVDLTSAIALEKQSPPKNISASNRINRIDSIDSSESFQPQVSKITKRDGRRRTAVRIAGPGITFTESGETIRGIIDLRPQIRMRRGVNAYTREGIEFQTSVTTIFTVGQIPETLYVVYEGDEKPENLRIVILADKIIELDEELKMVHRQVIKELIDGLDEADQQEIHRYIQDYRRTGGKVRYQLSPPILDPTVPFLFDPTRIFRAIYASSLDAKEEGYKVWTELPSYIATEIFRNMLAGEYYDYLYSPYEINKFPLQELKSNFALRIRHQGVLAFKFFERKDSTPFSVGQDWLEDHYIVYPAQELQNPKPLRVRGIKVIHASFSDLKPVNPDVREQLLQNWSAYWESEAEFSLAEQDLYKTRILNQARTEAQINLKERLNKLIDLSSYPDEALVIRMMQALENIASDPKNKQFLPSDTIGMLKSFWDWLL